MLQNTELFYHNCILNSSKKLICLEKYNKFSLSLLSNLTEIQYLWPLCQTISRYRRFYGSFVSVSPQEHEKRRCEKSQRLKNSGFFR